MKEDGNVKELIDQLLAIRQKCQKYGGALEAKLGARIIPNDPRRGCFAMIFNKSTLSLELLNFYYQIWKPPVAAPEKSIQAAREENSQRCIEQTKMFFIGTMSSIEFCAKESVKLYPTSSIGQNIARLATGRRIYLSDIIKESNNQGLVSTQEKYKWERLIWLRNLLVHNNGVADNDDVYTIDAVTVNLTNGIMIKGELDIFTNLVDSALELYNLWINSLENQP